MSSVAGDVYMSVLSEISNDSTSHRVNKKLTMRAISQIVQSSN